MKVFVVSEGYPEPSNTNLGIFAWDQTKALKESGLDVAFLVLDCRSFRRWRRWGYSAFEAEGIPVFRMDVPLGRLPDKLFLGASRKAFASLLRKTVSRLGKPDILHAHFMKTGASAAPAANEMGIPFVMTEHSSLILKGNISEAGKLFATATYQNASAVIAVSQALCQVIKQQYHRANVHVISNIVDTNVFTHQPVNRNCKEIRLVSAGNLIASKRHNMTIQAIAKLVPEYPDIQLTICGEGPERESLERLVSSLGIEKHIKLTGHISRQELAGILLSSDIFVLPSSFETFGLVYVEAMAAGLPVIATKCGGPEDFINTENGLLIPCDDLPALIKAIQQMIAMHNTYDKQKLQRDVIKHFSSTVIAEKLLSIYKHLQVD